MDCFSPQVKKTLSQDVRSQDMEDGKFFLLGHLNSKNCVERGKKLGFFSQLVSPDVEP